VEEAAKEMHVSVSTAYRYFKYLSGAGLLDPFPAGKYVLGPAIIEGDRNIRMTDPLIQVGRPVMQHLVVRSGGAGVAILCRMYRKCVMCVHQEPAVTPQGGISYERGRAMPMFRGASSKVIFANLPWRMARWFFERHQAEIRAAGFGSDWETVRSNLHRIRKAGVHVTHGEVDSGLVGIAAPVFRPDGNVLGSVAIAITEGEATPQSIANISALVQAAGREIDAGLQVLSLEKSADSATRTAGPGDASSAFGRSGIARPGDPGATERT
jgi:DNA-binding IclR family transcriptional regulator